MVTVVDAFLNQGLVFKNQFPLFCFWNFGRNHFYSMTAFLEHILMRSENRNPTYPFMQLCYYRRTTTAARVREGRTIQ